MKTKILLGCTLVAICGCVADQAPESQSAESALAVTGNVLDATDTETAVDDSRPLGGSGVQPGPGSLCRAGEAVFFECRIRREQFAVCGGSLRSPGAYAQYRHATRGVIDLEYPADPGPGSGTLAWSSTGWSGGGESRLQFSSEGQDYILYSRVIRTGFSGTNNPRFESGVMVSRAGTLLSDRFCNMDRAGHVDVDTSTASMILPRGEYAE